jgi:hypothetical protein
MQTAHMQTARMLLSTHMQTAHMQTAHMQTAHMQTAHMQTAHMQTAHKLMHRFEYEWFPWHMSGLNMVGLHECPIIMHRFERFTYEPRGSNMSGFHVRARHMSGLYYMSGSNMSGFHGM